MDQEEKKMGMKVGLRVFSIRESMMKNQAEAIEKAVEFRFRNLEAANHKALEDDGIGTGFSVKELKQVMDWTGARIVSAHISPLIKERFRNFSESGMGSVYNDAHDQI